MNRIFFYFVSILAAFIFTLFAPSPSWAADVSFSSLTVDTTGIGGSCLTSTSRSTDCDDRWTITPNGSITITNADGFYIAYLKEDGSIADIDFSGATFIFDPVLGDSTTATPLPLTFNNTVVGISPQNSSIQYSFIIHIEDAVSNETSGTIIYPAVTTRGLLGIVLNDWTLGAAMTVGNNDAGTNDESESLTNAVSAVSAAPSSTTVGETTSYTFTLTVDRAVNSGEVLGFFFTPSGVSGIHTGFDFSDATYEILGVTGAVATTTASYIGEIIVGGDMPANSYELTLSNVVNTATAGSYQINVTTETVSLSEIVDVAISDEFTLSEAETVSVPDKPTKLKVKKIAARSATLKWRAVDATDYYKVNLRSSKGKKIKTFKRVTLAKKNLTKKFLVAGKKYKFRVRACNDAGCSRWSKYKSFKTKIKVTKH